MIHFFALLFWAAGGLAFVAGLPELGIAVFAVIVLNGTFAFVQEERAERAAEQLKAMLPRRAVVLRDGTKCNIAAEGVVLGDTLLLTEGDRICADAELQTANGLAVDTSTLTGESIADHPGPGDAVFAGCFIVEGEAGCTVTAIGARTRLAGIAHLTHAQKRSATPLRKELDRVTRIIAGVAIAVGAVFFTVAVLAGMAATDGFLFAVGVTVAVVPEGLLPTVTMSLALGAQRMAAKNALVRHLEAVETLGSTTFICTDKTGTLTQNEMSVVEVWTPRGSARITGAGYAPFAHIDYDSDAVASALRDVASAAVRCSSGRVTEKEGEWVAHGDPMEAALDALARRVGYDTTTEETQRPETHRFPFDNRRRRMSVVIDRRIIVKGAPDALLPLCVNVPDRAAVVLDSIAQRGIRVLAVAVRDLGTDESAPDSATTAERGLSLIGLVGLEDPPREGTAQALRSCRRAGIRVAMLTGDHPETARAIAREVGLLGADDIVVRGDELPEDPAALGLLLDRDGIVVARVTPEDKLRVAHALRTRGHVVAMTGDGVNDAPALREAAIGIAMGKTGTDVAREAADLVLLDDNFATIVAAVEQGRATFANIRRFLTYHLTDNVAELAPFVVWALTAGQFPLAIGVLQVLALDIGTDILPALALGAEPPSSRVLAQPPIRGHLLDRRLFARSFGVLGPVEALFGLLAFLATFVVAGWRPGAEFPDGATLLAASGAAFTAIVLGQAANAFACRSTVHPAWSMTSRHNRYLVWAVLAEIVMLVGFLYVPPIATLLGQTGPTAVGAVTALLVVPALLGADAAAKHLGHGDPADR